MEPYRALRGLEQYERSPLGLRMGPLWEPYGALQGPCGALLSILLNVANL